MAEILTVPITKDIGWGFTLDDLIDQLKGFSGSRIEVPINSFGGSVFEGLSIYNVLLGRKETVWTKIIGYSMSMGSVIAMAGSRRFMPSEGYLMMHNPMMIAIGDAAEMEHAGEILNLFTNDLAAIYSKASGLEQGRILEMMDKETWLNGQKALDLGLVTNLSKGVQFQAKFTEEELDTFKNIPDELVNRKFHSMSFQSKLKEGLNNLVAILEEESTASGQEATPKAAVTEDSSTTIAPEGNVNPEASTTPAGNTADPQPDPEITGEAEADIINSLNVIGDRIQTLNGSIAALTDRLEALEQKQGNISTTIASLKAAAGKLPGGQTSVLDTTTAEKTFQSKKKVLRPSNEVEKH